MARYFRRDSRPVHIRLALAAIAGAVLVPSSASAQETYWVANRFSADLTEISICGGVVRTVAMSTHLSSAHVAPDGRIWVIRWLRHQISILNPDGTPITTFLHAMGPPCDVAFDDRGTAWITGLRGVENLDADGMSIQAIRLPDTLPRGITIDAQGNKWIAHGSGPPGSVSRIDPAGNVTNFPMPRTSQIELFGITADFRGLLQPSHIWVAGDGGPFTSRGELIELDADGSILNTYIVPAQSLGAPVVDLNGDVWVGDFRNGNFHPIDESTGGILATYLSPPDVVGLAMDSFGRLWLTSQVWFSAPGSPSEVRRIDPATGNLEVPVIVGVPSRL